MSTLKEFLVQHSKDSLSLDIETATSDEIIGLAMAYGPLMEHSEWFDIGEVLQNKKQMQRKFITHYGLYDAMNLLKYGIEIRIEFDTYSAARILLWERKEGFSLIGLSKEFLNIMWESVEDLLAKYEVTGMEYIPKAVCIGKCRIDAIATWRLSKVFKAMTATGSKKEYLIEVESQMNHVLAHMRFHGFGFSEKYMKFIKGDIKKQMNKIYQKISEYVPDINLSSNDELVQQLFSKRGLNIKSSDMPTTPKSGRVSVSAEMFEKFNDRHPILGLIAKWKHLDKLLNTYTDSYAIFAKRDGRIHSKIDSFGANTGRLVSSSPNMQNIPKKTEGIAIRKAFVSREGYSLVDIDYSQIQLIILAVFSQDKNLIEIFISGQDMHRKVASVLYDKPENEVTPEERNSVKAVNFGMIFGGGQWLFIPWAGEDSQKQKQYQEKWYAMFPGVKVFNNKYWSKEMQSRGYNETWYGRRRPLYKLYSDASGKEKAGLVRLLCNGDIQGTEGDLIKIAMVCAFDVMGKDTFMVMCVHDEIVFEIRDDKVKEFSDRIANALRGIEFPIPLKVSVSVGKNWYQMKELK